MSDSTVGQKTLYEEVCRAHNGIAEFRAKLLALLPLTSGTGIFILLNNKASLDHIFAIGIFGSAVTLGLFLYELRGIQRCNSLIRRGKQLEELLCTEGSSLGAFQSHSPAAFKFASNTWASIITYSSVASAWIYLAFSNYTPQQSAYFAGIAFAAWVTLGFKTAQRQRAVGD